MRRILKKRTKSTFFYISLVFFIFIFIFASLFISKAFFPDFLSQDEKIISPEVKMGKIFDFESKLNVAGIEVKDISIASSGAYIVVFLKNGPKVYFSNEKQVSTQVRSLHEVLTRLTIDGPTKTGKSDPKLIDFRYEKPVVKF